MSCQGCRFPRLYAVASGENEDKRRSKRGYEAYEREKNEPGQVPRESRFFIQYAEHYLGEYAKDGSGDKQHAQNSQKPQKQYLGTVHKTLPRTKGVQKGSQKTEGPQEKHPPFDQKQDEGLPYGP
jgi:hypothetical protein